MKKILTLLILSLILSFSIRNFVNAAENKFGIHILEPSDLVKAQELVNSTGGDWGYVTVVIRDDDLNFDKWQNFMDQCREKHLIPLVRIATHLQGQNWVKPTNEDLGKWTDFLKSLNWPVKNQYLIIFNEPNHSKEWGGEVSPREYARILLNYSSAFKLADGNFQILNAGLDLAAADSPSTMEAFKFMQEMNWEIPGIFDRLDDWVSHSYPNHGYLGKPWESGKTSIKGYQWELWHLKNSLKTEKNLEVFITETGWPKRISGTKGNNKYYDEAVVANYLKSAFENIWLNDPQVKAVTPFLLNYPEDLFAAFSWLDKSGNPYPQFKTIKDLKKESWWPEQIIRFDTGKLNLPPFLLTDSIYRGRVNFLNTGQSIFGEKEEFTIPLKKESEQIKVSPLTSEQNLVKPKEKSNLVFEIKTGSQSGEFNFEWDVLGEQKIKVLKPSILTKISLSFWQKFLSKIKFW